MIFLFFPFHMSDHHLAKGLSLSSVHEFTPSWYSKLVFSTNIPFQTRNTPLQNCVLSLGSIPSPLTVYPDFDCCYSHFMPYRMTPSVRHRAIEVHYYYYYIWAITVLKIEEIFQVISINVIRWEHSLMTWKNLRVLKLLWPSVLNVWVKGYV